MARRIRTTRKKFVKKPDEFISTWAKVIQYLYVHQVFFYVVFTAVIVLCAGVVALSFLYFHRHTESQEKMGEAIRVYHSAGTSQEELEKALLAFTTISKKYPFSSTKKFALLYEGSVLFDLKKYDEALDAFKSAKRRLSGPLKDIAQEDIGYTLERMGKYTEAADTFLTLISPDNEEAYLDLIRNYEKAGNKDEVKKYGKEYLTLFPDSSHAPAIKEKIERTGEQ